MLRRRLTLIVFAVAVATVAAAPVVAQEGGGGAVGELRRGYDEAVAEEAEALAAWEDGVAALVEIERQLEEAQQAVAYVEGLVAAGEVKVAEAAADVARGRAALAEREAELRVESDRLAAQAVEAFMGGTRPEDVAFQVAMEAESATDIQSSNEYSAVVLDGQRVTVERVTALRAAAAAAAAELERLEGEARDARDAVDGFRIELEVQRDEIVRLGFRQIEEVGRLEAALAEVQSRRASYEARLQALERDSDGVAQILQAVQRDQEPTPVIAKVRTPIEGAEVTSTFGPRMHPIFQELRHHNGLDIHGVTGQEIRAAADGVVVMAEERIGFGLVTVVDHGGQVATLYAHQSRLGVRVGDLVERGQVIGHVGSTGYSTGPHLHFEIRLLGLPVDPLPLIDFAEPLPGSCEALLASTDPAAIEELSNREDCDDEDLGG